MLYIIKIKPRDHHCFSDVVSLVSAKKLIYKTKTNRRKARANEAVPSGVSGTIKLVALGRQAGIRLLPCTQGKSVQRTIRPSELIKRLPAGMTNDEPHSGLTRPAA